MRFGKRSKANGGPPDSGWGSGSRSETPSGLPEFPYHPDPVATGSVVESSEACVACGRARGFVYDGPVYTAHDVNGSLCPWCIADGSAAETLDAEFTDVGFDVPDDVPREVLIAIATRTPGFTGWQQPHWLYHCGDGASFVGITEDGSSATYEFCCRHCGQHLAYSDSD